MRPSSEIGEALQINGREFPLKGSNLLLVDRGRETGERSALWLQDRKLLGLGYFQLNHQINNIHILKNLLTPLKDQHGSLKVLAGYLENKQVQEIIEL